MTYYTIYINLTNFYKMTYNTYTSSKLNQYAISYLSKYSSSKANLEKILRNKIRRLKIEKNEKYLLYNSLEKIIYDLEKNNFINDLNYVLSKIRIFTFQGKSRMFIKNYLLQKGINKKIISRSLEELDEQDCDWEIKSAIIFARKKRLLKNSDDRKKNLSKMARAGFSYDISKKILDKI